MNYAIQTALIGLGGVILGQIINSQTQRQNLAEQRRGDEIIRARERRRERLLDAVAGLLEVSDPQSENFNYTNVLKHTHHAQLLLDPCVQEERELNNTISELAGAVHNFIPVKHLDISQKVDETQRLLKAQSAVAEKCRFIVWSGSKSLRITDT
jgi:hypothetical protein